MSGYFIYRIMRCAFGLYRTVLVDADRTPYDGGKNSFIPMAVILGIVFQCLITVGGVPDEPGHLDTAYKYSNKILLVEDTETPGTIYKRVCDVEMSDMLANGLESNSYYRAYDRYFCKTRGYRTDRSKLCRFYELSPGNRLSSFCFRAQCGKEFLDFQPC